MGYYKFPDLTFIDKNLSTMFSLLLWFNKADMSCCTSFQSVFQPPQKSLICNVQQDLSRKRKKTLKIHFNILTSMPDLLRGLLPSSFLTKILLILAYIVADLANHQTRNSDTFLAPLPLLHQEPLMHKVDVLSMQGVVIICGNFLCKFM